MYGLAVKDSLTGSSSARFTGFQYLGTEVGKGQVHYTSGRAVTISWAPSLLVSVSPLKDPSWLGRARGSNLTHLCPPHSPQRHPGQAGLPEEASGNTD